MQPEKANMQINFRIRPKSKNLLQEAAHLSGVQLTEFILAAAESQAKKVVSDYIENREVKLLSPKDWFQLTTHLETPPPLNAKMKRLLSKDKAKPIKE